MSKHAFTPVFGSLWVRRLTPTTSERLYLVVSRPFYAPVFKRPSCWDVYQYVALLDLESGEVGKFGRASFGDTRIWAPFEA